MVFVRLCELLFFTHKPSQRFIQPHKDTKKAARNIPDGFL